MKQNTNLTFKGYIWKFGGVFIDFLIIFSFSYWIISNIVEFINYSNHFSIDLVTTVDSTSSSSRGVPQDPVRWWPSGTAQSWGIIGAAIATYRAVPGSSRTKAAAAFATIGVTAPAAVFSMAVENPNGFNRLMYSWVQYKQTGQWPSPDNLPSNVSSTTVDSAFEKASSTKVSDHLKKFLGDENGSDLFNSINSTMDSFLKDFLSIFNMSSLEGYFDELYGFIWFSQVLLFIISVSLLILFLLYILLVLFLLNKDYFINRFSDKNRFIKFYLKYQIILGYISLYLLPVLIILGLIELIYILNYLITHPLPVEGIGIDPHVWVGGNKPSL
jgi:hypothetical protein